jgi:hypothetical protein
VQKGVTSLVLSQIVGGQPTLGDAALGRLISGMIEGLTPLRDPVTGELVDRDGDGRADKVGFWEGLKQSAYDVATAPFLIGRTGDFVRDQSELIEFGQLAKENGFDQALEQYATSILNRQTTEAIVRSAGSVTEWMKQKRQNNEVEVIDFNGTQAKFLELNEDGDYLIFDDEEERVDFYARRLGNYYEEGEFAVDGSGQFILEEGTRSKINDDGSYYTDWVQDGASWMRQSYRSDGESVLMAVDPYKQKPLTSAEVFDQGFFNGIVADEAGRVLEFYENGRLTERRTRVETLDIEQTADGNYRIRRNTNAGYVSQQFDEQGNEIKQELGVGKDLIDQYRLAQEEQNQRLRDLLSPPDDPSNDLGLEGAPVLGKDFWPEVQRLGGVLPPGSRLNDDGTLEWPTGPMIGSGNIPIGTIMILPGPAGLGGVVGGTATFAWYGAPTAQGTKVASGGQVRLDDEEGGDDQPPGFWDRVKNWWNGVVTRGSGPKYSNNPAIDSPEETTNDVEILVKYGRKDHKDIGENGSVTDKTYTTPERGLSKEQAKDILDTEQSLEEIDGWWEIRVPVGTKVQRGQVKGGEHGGSGGGREIIINDPLPPGSAIFHPFKEE